MSQKNNKKKNKRKNLLTNILAVFLRRNRAEVVEVCIFEYDEKREKELI